MSPACAVVRRTIRPAGTSPMRGDRQGQRPRRPAPYRRRGAGRRNPGPPLPSRPRKPAAISRSSRRATPGSGGNRAARRPWRRDRRRSRRAPCARWSRRILGQEMDASTSASTVRTRSCPGLGVRQAASSLRPKPASAGERREVAGDQVVLGGAGHRADGPGTHGATRFARPRGLLLEFAGRGPRGRACRGPR